MASTKNECEIVNRLSRKVEKELSENMDKVNEDIAEVNEKLEDVAVIDDSTQTSTTTWSSSKIKTEIDAGGGGGSSFEPAYSMAKQFYALSTSYMEKINTLRDFPDITISPGHMYLVNWGVYKRDTGVLANMNANFKLEILSNNSVQRTIEVNQPNGSGQQIFGTSIQPFTFLVSKDATNIGFKLYGNNSSGEKSYTFDFVIQIYDLGEVK
jgi:hypothetical protein